MKLKSFFCTFAPLLVSAPLLQHCGQKDTTSSIGTAIATSADHLFEIGIVRVKSANNFDTTFKNLQTAIANRAASGLRVFADINFTKDAATSGLQMDSTRMIIFGNPKGGTPIMLATPSIALDLPIKILVAADKTGKVTVSYNSLSYLQNRHGTPAELIEKLAIIETIAKEITNKGEVKPIIK